MLKLPGEEKSNLGGIIGGAVGGAIFLLIILALLYFCVLKKPRTTKSTSTVTMSANTGSEPRKISGGATVTVNPTAGEVDVEKQNKVEDKSEDEDPNVSELFQEYKNLLVFYSTMTKRF